jgi:holo-[acyl-carrier-protein] synthase
MKSEPAVKSKIFSKEEECLTVNQLAGNFAAKEALFKSLSNQSFFDFRECSVLRTKKGKPFFRFKAKMLEQLKNENIYISISNSKQFAIAIVVTSR